MSHIKSFGLCVPETRLRMEELAEFYGLAKKTKVDAIAVPNLDEDTVTMGFEAAKTALKLSGVGGKEIGALIYGSISPPFQKKSVSVLLSQSLNLRPDIITMDFGSSTKLAGEALLAADSLIEAGRVDKALVVCSDYVPQEGRLAFDFPSSAGAAALLLSKNGFARINHFSHYQSEVYDFWQLSGEKKCRYEPVVYNASFNEAITQSLGSLLSSSDIPFEKISQLSFHLPFVDSGTGLLKKLEKSGVAKNAAQGCLMVVEKLGNLYSPSLLFGMITAFLKSSLGDLIAAASYGSGSSDAFLLEMVDEMTESLKDPSVLTSVFEKEQTIDMARFQELNDIFV